MAKLRNAVPFLTTAMLHGEEGNYPSLTLKAHAGKIFTMYLATTLRDAASRETNLENAELLLASMAADSILRWFHLQEIAPKRFLGEAAAKEIATAGYSFLRIYQALAKTASTRNIFRWKLLPKHHVSRMRWLFKLLLPYICPTSIS